MRRKIRILISRLVVAFVFMMGATGCTFSHSNKQAKTEATMTQASKKPRERKNNNVRFRNIRKESRGCPRRGILFTFFPR